MTPHEEIIESLQAPAGTGVPAMVASEVALILARFRLRARRRAAWLQRLWRLGQGGSHCSAPGKEVRKIVATLS